MSAASPSSARPERETAQVSELPPPVPPPPGGAGGGAGGASTGATGRDWDWDRLQELAERWYRPLTHADGWLALVFLFGSAIASGVLFGLMVLFGAIVVGLLFVLVGFLLVVPFFHAVDLMAQLERRLAGLAGHRIEPRPTRPLTGIGPRAMLTAVSDPVRWRQVAFLTVNVVLAPLLLALGALPLSFVAEAVFGGWWGVLALPLAALAAGLIPRVATWTARLKAEIDAWFLGADRLAAAEARVSALSTQRAEILDAVATERRRIERNLHDGVQQQLVAIGLDLGIAARHVEDDPDRARQLIASARDKVQASIGELRQLGRGLHPSILEDRGLDAALSAVVAGSPIPISVQVDPELDLSTDMAEVLYFVANEAIANVLKHSRARVASVHVTKVAANVRLTVHDDGVGGADSATGTGLAGIRARVHAVDGAWSMTSPVGGPTTIVVEVPRHV